MKPRTTSSPRSDAREMSPVPITGQRNATARELAEARMALDRAQEQIELEVRRREKAQQAFEQIVSTERERMRKQLHDGLGQVLTSISFLASSLRARLRNAGVTDPEELQEIIALINRAIAESRSIAAACDGSKASQAAQTAIPQ